MHQKMVGRLRLLPRLEVRAELQDRLDMVGAGHHPVGRGDDDVMEAQRRAVMPFIGREGLDLGKLRVEQGEHMGNLPLPLRRQFLDAANGQFRRKNHIHGLSFQSGSGIRHDPPVDLGPYDREMSEL